MNPNPRPAPHDSGDDPRVDILVKVMHPDWHHVTNASIRDRRRAATRDLLARLDAAAPARDDSAGLRWWLDGEIAEEETRLAHVVNPLRDVRLSALREVRERLGATTHTPEEG